MENLLCKDVTITIKLKMAGQLQLQLQLRLQRPWAHKDVHTSLETWSVIHSQVLWCSRNGGKHGHTCQNIGHFMGSFTRNDVLLSGEKDHSHDKTVHTERKHTVRLN